MYMILYHPLKISARGPLCPKFGLDHPVKNVIEPIGYGCSTSVGSYHMYTDFMWILYFAPILAASFK